VKDLRPPIFALAICAVISVVSIIAKRFPKALS
jgi:hypothetical protein